MMRRGIVLAIGFCYVCCLPVFGQSEAPKGWHLLDYARDSFYGISLNKAYSFLKEKHKQSVPVIVAVLDSGIDTTHEDLKNILWTNAKEIPGNGIDDDGNGYIDDIHGWNFLGGKDGRDVNKTSDEKSRIYHRLRSKYADPSLDTNALDGKNKTEFELWKRVSKEMTSSNEDQEELLIIEVYARALKRHDKVIQREMATNEYTSETLEQFRPLTKMGKDAKFGYLTCIKMLGIDADETNISIISDLDEYIDGKRSGLESKVTAPFDYRGDIVKDDYYNFSDRYYGNNDVMGPMSASKHGTHVSGLIGAQRGNGKGIDGVADNVRIMMVRIVPDGDEYDKDVALAIRYAVDNGAKVINMSFGKYFSPEKNWVDSAIQYAASKDVLLVHASGNENNDVDEKENFPNPYLKSFQTKAGNFINVGASSDPKISGSITADFSNFGKESVDVFAPGVRMYSTFPGGDNYGNLKGTSMAAPVVTGLAALLRSYYPELTAVQVKKVIETSVLKPDTSVTCIKPGTKGDAIPFMQLSTTGGIINAYQAVEAADTTKPLLSSKEPIRINSNSTSKPATKTIR